MPNIFSLSVCQFWCITYRITLQKWAVFRIFMAQKMMAQFGTEDPGKGEPAPLMKRVAQKVVN